MNRLLEGALVYVARGYRVLPLRPGGKAPHTALAPRGLKDASDDLTIIRKWWALAPEAGVGLLPPENVLVLDVDASEAWERLKEDYPELLQAPRQRTPKGGVHVFLRLPPGLGGSLSASTRALPGADIRGLGRAYLAAYPTRLPNGAYVWERPLVGPEELPLVPAGLLQRLLPPPPPPPREVVLGGSPKRLRGLLEAFAEKVAAAPVGQRHLTLIAYARAAGGVLPHGLDPLEAEEALVSAALQAGLPEKEAREAVRWGLKVGAQAPLPLEEPGGFWNTPGFWNRGVYQNFSPLLSEKTGFGTREVKSEGERGKPTLSFRPRLGGWS